MFLIPPKLPRPASVTQQICRQISPLSHTAVSKHGLCAIVQGMVPLLSLLFWEPKGSVEFLSLLDSTGVASLSCTFQAELPTRSPASAEHSPHHSKQDEVLPCLPFPLCLLHKLCLPFPYDESEQGSGKGSHQLELNRISES